MVYKFTCSQGHDPVTFTVEAENDDEALQKLLEQSGPHAAQVHPEMANMSPGDVKNLITSSWVKEG